MGESEPCSWPGSAKPGLCECSRAAGPLSDTSQSRMHANNPLAASFAEPALTEPTPAKKETERYVKQYPLYVLIMEQEAREPDPGWEGGFLPFPLERVARNLGDVLPQFGLLLWPDILEFHTHAKPRPHIADHGVRLHLDFIQPQAKS
jgi:hypothetical protein